jgi:hypothetical protein
LRIHHINEQEIDMRIEDRFDRMLDQALEMTFPASDPISIYMPTDLSAAKASVENRCSTRFRPQPE